MEIRSSLLFRAMLALLLSAGVWFSAVGESTFVYREIELRPGETAQYEAGADWTSDAPEVATASINGMITAHNEGFATLTASLPAAAACSMT